MDLVIKTLLTHFTGKISRTYFPKKKTSIYYFLNLQKRNIKIRLSDKLNGFDVTRCSAVAGTLPTSPTKSRTENT